MPSHCAWIGPAGTEIHPLGHTSRQRASASPNTPNATRLMATTTSNVLSNGWLLMERMPPSIPVARDALEVLAPALHEFMLPTVAGERGCRDYDTHVYDSDEQPTGCFMYISTNHV